MRILFLSESSYPRHPGGAGKSTHLLAAGLVARGHDVLIFCGSDDPTMQETIDGVRVHRVCWKEADEHPRSRREAATAAAILEYLAREIPPSTIDLLYDSGGFLSYFFPVANEWKTRHGVPYVIHYRYLQARERLAPLFGFVDVEFFCPETPQDFPSRLADEVVCPSAQDARLVERLFYPASGRPTVIPEPVEPCSADPIEVTRLRQELLDEGDFLLFFGGRIIDAQKGPEVVRKSVERIRRSNPRARLLLAVQEDSWLDPYRHLGSGVVALPWLEKRSDLFTALAAADLTLVPSHQESFGMICAESLAAGTPVIASAVGAMPDMVRPGKNGFLLEGRPKEWVGQIADDTLRLMDDPERLRRMSEAARDSAVGLDVPGVAARVEELCRHVVAASRRELPYELPAPALTVEDRKRYLVRLRVLFGDQGHDWGNEVLSSWHRTASSRCSACTRSRIARDAARLNSLRPWRPLHWVKKVTGRYRAAARAATMAACPLGELQKQTLSSGSVPPEAR